MNKFAFVFPGQGSQSPGMLEALSQRHDVIAETFAQAGDVLGRDLWTMVREGPVEALNATEITQPVMLAGGVAVWRAWCELSRARPEKLAGHSLGEYSALVAAEAMDFADAVAIVAERARLMQQAVPAGTGAMAAVLGLDDEVVEAVCREVAEGQTVAPANYNSPGQLVVAGEAAAVERAVRACLDAGAKRAMTLPVSVPSHCALMAPAADRLAEALDNAEIRPPVIPVLHNVDGMPRSAPQEIRQALIDQLASPVRWTHSIRQLVASGIGTIGECGPGRVLCGLGKRVDRSIEWIALENPDALAALASEQDTRGER